MFRTVCRLIPLIPSFRSSPIIRVYPEPVTLAISNSDIPPSDSGEDRIAHRAGAVGEGFVIDIPDFEASGFATEFLLCLGDRWPLLSQFVPDDNIAGIRQEVEFSVQQRSGFRVSIFVAVISNLRHTVPSSRVLE